MNNGGGGSKKIVKNKFNMCCKGGNPRIYENLIFPAYVPEKNKIITPWNNFTILSMIYYYFFDSIFLFLKLTLSIIKSFGNTNSYLLLVSRRSNSKNLAIFKIK